MISSAIVEKLKKQALGDFKGRHFEAWLIIQVVSWYLRYPLSYRDPALPDPRARLDHSRPVLSA